MKTLRFVLAGALALVVAAPAFAQRIEIKLQPGFGRGDAPLLAPEAVEKLKFSDTQKDQYSKAETQYKDATKAAQEKFRAEIKGDREKYKEAFEKFQTDSKKAREDAFAKVEATLTAEQKTVFAQVKAQQPLPGGVRPVQPIGGGIGQVLPAGVQQRLQLTDDQKKQIDAIQKEVEAKVMKVLNDEQKKQLEDMKKGTIIRPRPIQPQPNIRRIQPAVPNVLPALPDVKRD